MRLLIILGWLLDVLGFCGKIELRSKAVSIEDKTQVIKLQCSVCGEYFRKEDIEWVNLGCSVCCRSCKLMFFGE